MCRVFILKVTILLTNLISLIFSESAKHKILCTKEYACLLFLLYARYKILGLFDLSFNEIIYLTI